MSLKYSNTITEDSIPVYGYFPIYFFSSNYWDQDDWVLWHKKNKERYGTVAAKEKFLKYWNDAPLLAANVDFRNPAFSKNSNFIAYAKANDFYNELFSGILSFPGKIESTIVNTGQDALSSIDNIAASVKSFSAYLLPMLLILGIVFAYFYFKKHKTI